VNKREKIINLFYKPCYAYTLHALLIFYLRKVVVELEMWRDAGRMLKCMELPLN